MPSEPPAALSGIIRLCSYNIYGGITAQAYHHYVTRGMAHLLGHRLVEVNLKTIAARIRDFHVVALQEADLGSLRSKWTNQAERLALLAGFEHFYAFRSRNVGPFAQVGLAVLSRIPAHSVVSHRLPGRFGGRGALTVRFRLGDVEVLVVNVHLSLGKADREEQLGYLGNILAPARPVVFLGDMNCSPSEVASHPALAPLRLQGTTMPTYPSWRPKKSFDQIWTSPDFRWCRSWVLDSGPSDHLPLGVEAMLDALDQQSHAAPPISREAAL